MENMLNLLKSALYALFVYLGIKTGIVKILFYMMVIDSAFGIIKALRLGEKFSFKVLMWGMISKLTLLIIPMVLALMAKGLNFDFNYFVVAVLNILVVNEAISCITNMLTIKTGKRIENTDYVTMLLNAIRKGLTGIIQRLLGAIEGAKIDNSKNKRYDTD